MDPRAIAAIGGLADKAAHLSILYVVVGLFVIVAAFALLVMFGEWALGINLRRFNDNVEKLADEGDVWPGIVAFYLLPYCILGLSLWLGLR